MTFRVVRMGNDWESLFYYFADDEKKRLALSTGQRVRLRAPTGELFDACLAYRPEVRGYFDHSIHETKVHTGRFGIEWQAFGATVFIPLEHFELDDESCA